MRLSEIFEIHNCNHLNKLLNSGLIQLYQEIFAEPPEYQVWSNETLKEFFVRYLTKGHLFIAFDSTHKLIGFSAVLPLVESSVWLTRVTDGFSTYTLDKDFLLHKFSIDAESAWYVADLGVAAQYRKQGLGADLMKTVIADRKPILIRVSLVREGAIALYNKLGFKPMGLFQKANYKQQDGSIKTFEKMLMMSGSDTYIFS